ncbi:MAG: TlpA disulfide reductase family protein [Paenibacillus macerans]|uniref:TlpA family protein disulfide reductase n=1 Tax=Paenibacillus TaxID=44249 RepID=UPI002907E686|nr:TlpA disulfide reductase family protein [Paenibacillus macerans]MDU7473962.1 TlpA disulfide reductase family protein [Paenibacillus macerans]
MNRTLTYLIVFLCAGAVLWVALSNRHSSEAHQGHEKLSIGSAAPVFQAVSTYGEKLSLDEYRGKVIVLNFWASWCGPCVKEMPLIHRISRNNAPDAVTLFVNVGESKGTVNEFLSDHQLDFPVIIDATGKISGLYKVTALPTTYVIDQAGNIAQPIIGEISSEEQLQTYIDSVN